MFPAIEPYHSEFLRVSDLHTLYLEQSGNPQGLPVVLLHGGPGAGTVPEHRQFFDPTFYRIILFDQRGAGKSTPVGETRENTTAALISDLEKIRSHLGIEKWLLFGGSWGSTLAISYGICHPERCLGFVLRGIFTMKEAEVHWFLTQSKLFFPDLWYPLIQRLAALKGKTINDSDSLSAENILDLMKDGGEQEFLEFGKFENSIATLMPPLPQELDGESCKNMGKIEHHFFTQNRHEQKDLWVDLKKICHLPCHIIQGRYDVICPPITAYRLHQAWPNSKLVIVPNAGHSAFDPPLHAALCEAVETFKTQL